LDTIEERVPTTLADTSAGVALTMMLPQQLDIRRQQCHAHQNQQHITLLTTIQNIQAKKGKSNRKKIINYQLLQIHYSTYATDTT